MRAAAARTSATSMPLQPLRAVSHRDSEGSNQGDDGEHAADFVLRCPARRPIMRASTHPPTLVRQLERIVGPDAVFWRPEDLLLFEYDGTIDRGRPSVVAYPRTAEQVAAIVRLARTHGLPLVPRGAGTGLSGGALATEGGILMP